LSVRLERYVYLTLVTLALCATILVASPAAAQAATQDTRDVNRAAGATTRTHHYVVVRPGDSLWSISSEQLGPNATPPRIEGEVERIYALNRDRIGADPSLIFPGQRLSLPPVGRSSTQGSPTQATTSTQEEATRGSAARAGETRRAAKGEAATQTPKKTFDEVADKAGGAPKQAAERATLPDMAAAPPVPTARPLTSSGASVPEDAHAKHRLLGWALLALSFATAFVPAFLAARNRWRRRAEERSIAQRWAEETYRANYAHFDPLSRDIITEGAPTSAPVPAPVANGQPSGASGDGTPTEGNRRMGTLTPVRRRRKSIRRRSRRAQPLREGLATGAHNPNVRRHLRGAPSDALRKRRRAKEPRRRPVVITRALTNASKARSADEGGR
jgi:LysM repeat protein